MEMTYFGRRRGVAGFATASRKAFLAFLVISNCFDN